MIKKIAEWSSVCVFLISVGWFTNHYVSKIYDRICCGVIPDSLFDAIIMAILMLGFTLGLLFMFIRGLILTVTKIQELCND